MTHTVHGIRSGTERITLHGVRGVQSHGEWGLGSDLEQSVARGVQTEGDELLGRLDGVGDHL